MASNSPRTTIFRKRILNRVLSVFFLSAAVFAFSSSKASADSFASSRGISDFLPAAEGEPPIDFCAKWNPEFSYRGYRCCSNQVSRGFASTSKRGRRRANSCAPDRIKWSFCDEMTPEQREYVQNVKSGKVDALENIQKAIGSRGGQSFCSVSNGFLVEGRPIVPTEENRIKLRNEARCATFATDPLAGAMEWLGREIKREYHEPEFAQASLVIGDASAPRGGCISGRGGRRAHKSHTSGVDIDVRFFNPRSGHTPEERFSDLFYVASNWWMLKKVFKNPYACVKIVFVDKKKIRMLERYAKTDADWSKYRGFIRHARGHRDHFHIRVGSGPGVPGCMSDPNLEEAEDLGDDTENLTQTPRVLADGSEAPSESGEDASESADIDQSSNAARKIAAIVGEEADAEGVKPSIADEAIGAVPPTGIVDGKPSEASVKLAQATLPPHKMEPAISAKYQEKPSHRRRGKSRKSRRVH